MKFGFLTDRTEVNCNEFTIKPVKHFDDVMSRFYESVKVSNGWIYGPEVQLKQNSKEEKTFKNSGPICCENSYFILSTHEIITNITDENILRFIILGYAFLQGVYLSPDQYKVLWKIPYEPGTLNGLLLFGNDYQKGLEKIYQYSQKVERHVLEQTFAVIHWYLIGQTYRFEWDKFDAQYKVLDGIYRISNLRAKSHAHRPVVLAEEFNLKLPNWAKIEKKQNDSSLSKIRNNLVHEAIYADKPIGYAHPKENYSLEFRSFNTKLICKILGIETPYLKSIPESIDRFAWDIYN